jgi:hypothetical protein
LRHATPLMSGAGMRVDPAGVVVQCDAVILLAIPA